MTDRQIAQPLMIAIDDEPSTLELVRDALEDMKIRVMTAADSEFGFELIRQNRPQFVLLDLNMPRLNGLQVLEKIVDFDPGIEVYLLTGHYSTATAVEAIQKGAADYLTKPISIQVLRSRINNAIEEFKLRYKTGQLEQDLVSSLNFQGMVGRSPRMLEVFSKMRRIAPHFNTVLVTGPSGTGKELVARALHQLSPVKDGPLVVCNCAGIPESLAESEWFGYVKGAFTGADQDRLGLFEHAHGGTIFLDEIGELQLSLQAKLLRVLQTHEIQRVGSSIARKINVRVVAATNRNLKDEVREKRFREDLFYRISMVEIELPALAERKEDLPLLERHFIQKFSAEYGKSIMGITRRAQNLCARYQWPGNIRQLENVIGNACIMTDGPTIDIGHLPADLRSEELLYKDSRLLTLEEKQRSYINRILAIFSGNKQRAAEVLGISRSTLYKYLEPDAQATESREDAEHH